MDLAPWQHTCLVLVQHGTYNRLEALSQYFAHQFILKVQEHYGPSLPKLLPCPLLVEKGYEALIHPSPWMTILQLLPIGLQQLGASLVPEGNMDLLGQSICPSSLTIL